MRPETLPHWQDTREPAADERPPGRICAVRVVLYLVIPALVGIGWLSLIVRWVS